MHHRSVVSLRGVNSLLCRIAIRQWSERRGVGLTTGQLILGAVPLGQIEGDVCFPSSRK